MDIDRSFGQGVFVDRLYLRREIAPEAEIVFSARVAPDGEPSPRGRVPTTLELLRDGDLVEAWELDTSWRDFKVTLPVDAVAPFFDGWPHSCVRLTWQVREEAAPAFEIRSLSASRTRRSRRLKPRRGPADLASASAAQATGCGIGGFLAGDSLPGIRT